MRDIFTERHVDTFCEDMGALLSGMAALFPKCASTKDYHTWFRNVVADNKGKQLAMVQKWEEALRKPLPKGSTKYAKAIFSLTETEVCCFHAFKYRDVGALEKSSASVQDLDVCAKLPAMSAEHVRLMWEYFDHMNDLAFAACRTTPPVVPSAKEIEEDIAKRKRRAPLPAPALNQGLEDTWRSLAASMNLDTGAADAVAAFRKVGDAHADCKARSPELLEALSCAFSPHLPIDVLKAKFGEPQWEMLERCLSLSTVESSIPPKMMRNIEALAGKLAEDLQSGKATMESLSVEEIGKDVMSSMTESDMKEFSLNMDKLLPALAAFNSASQ